MISIVHPNQKTKMKKLKKSLEIEPNFEFSLLKAMWKFFDTFKNLTVPQLNCFKLQCGNLCGNF